MTLATDSCMSLDTRTINIQTMGIGPPPAACATVAIASSMLDCKPGVYYACDTNIDYRSIPRSVERFTVVERFELTFLIHLAH